MMKEAAIQKFFEQFGIPAYPQTAVPDDVTFPFLVHNFPTDAFDGESNGQSGTVYLRYYTTSETVPDMKAQEISDAIGRGGVSLKCDGGYIWLKRGSPFKINAPQEQGTEETKFLKTKQLNITAEYLTLN